MLFLFRSAPEVEKRIHSKLFRKFWRSRGTKEPAYITVPFRHSLEQTLHLLALSIVHLKMVAVMCHRRRYSFLAWTARLPVLLKGTLCWKTFRGLCFFGNLLQGAVQDLIAQVDDVVVLVRCEDLEEEILEP